MCKMALAALLLVLASLVEGNVLHTRFDIDDHPFPYPMNEGTRQLNDIAGRHHRDFRKMREENRDHPSSWGYGDIIVHKAIVMGEISCPQFMSFGSENHMPPQYLKIYDVQVIDKETGEEYPVIIRDNDFISYNPDLSEVQGRRQIKIKITHTGCTPVDAGCRAETLYHSYYQHTGNVERLEFMEMNLNSKTYQQSCSVFRKVLNFWPFYHFF